MKWSEFPKDKFLNNGKFQRNTRIDVEWTGNLEHDTAVKSCLLNSTSEWFEVIIDSYVPRYKHGKDPHDVEAEIYKFSEWYNSLSPDDIKEFSKCLQDGIYVTLAFDTKMNAKLIADGLKRSAAVHDLIKKRKTFPAVTIIECYGPSVHDTFPTEFSNIQKLSLKK